MKKAICDTLEFFVGAFIAISLALILDSGTPFSDSWPGDAPPFIKAVISVLYCLATLYVYGHAKLLIDVDFRKNTNSFSRSVVTMIFLYSTFIWFCWEFAGEAIGQVNLLIGIFCLLWVMVQGEDKREQIER